MITAALSYITWDVNPNIIESPIMIRYYGVLWALSFFIGLFLMRKMMDKDNAPEEFTDKIFIYIMIGSVVGARLGHVIFYQPDYYFTAAHWMEIPKIWEGGLASHGGLIGIIIANWLYSKRVSKRSYFWSLDKIIVTAAIASSLIRVGNLMNSEIIGRQSDSSMAIFFQYEAKLKIQRMVKNISNDGLQISEITFTPTTEDANGTVAKMKVNVTSSKGGLSETYLSNVAENVKYSLKEYFDQMEDHINYYENENTLVAIANPNAGVFEFEVYLIPRIPTQILEATTYFLIFLLLMYGYWIGKWHRKRGLITGIALVLTFGSRYIIEMFKENQTVAEDATLNMGQILSILPVIGGILIIIWAIKKPSKDTTVILDKQTDK